MAILVSYTHPSLPSSCSSCCFYSQSQSQPQLPTYPQLPVRRRKKLVVFHAKAQSKNWDLLAAVGIGVASASASAAAAAAAAVLFLGVGLAAATSTPSSSSSFSVPPLTLSQDDSHDIDTLDSNPKIQEEDQEFEKWKSKTFALSVPLNIVALRASVPPSWVKDFTQSQGRRLRLRLKYIPTLHSIFSQLFTSPPSSDLVTIGDSSLSSAIQNAIIQPVPEVEDQHWFQALPHKWKVYLRRNSKGDIDPNGQVWAAPYRWGTMVIAYKKSKFRQHKLAPIEDWADLWRPELAGRIAMVDSPREVLGAVLKYMGASYNAMNIDLQVAGGKNAVQRNLSLLAKQVRIFDSMHYLKAFGVGDVWVVVGWSSDVLPVAKRMSNVTVIVPKSGTSLWADLWAIPAAVGLDKNLSEGRTKGPSPLIHQWIEFCLQAARAMPFEQCVIPGAIPSTIEKSPAEVPKAITKGKPELDTNLFAGIPPPEILTRCEFLEPLSDAALSEYKWLIASMQTPRPPLIHTVQNFILSTIQAIRLTSPLTWKNA